MRTILYIQHASTLGGSAMSLLYTLQGIKVYAGDKYKIVLALAKWNEEMAGFYKNEGFEVIDPGWIDTYEHTQLSNFSLINPLNWVNEFKQLFTLKTAKKRTLELLKQLKPDIVHLNSVVLLGSAYAVKEMNIPLVWHVREPSYDGLFKLRKNFLINCLNKLATNTIFICYADMKSWNNPKNGQVVYNFVDIQKFSSNKIVIKDERVISLIRLNDGKYPIILFLGGIGKIKGGIELIKALQLLKKDYSNFCCIMPSSEYTFSGRWQSRIARLIFPLIGYGTEAQLFQKAIDKANINTNIIRLSYVTNISEYISISDLVVFPSIRPHFARPIIEALAMGKKVVGSNLPGVSELIPNGKIGFLSKPNDFIDLHEKISKAIKIDFDKVAIQSFVERNFSQEENIKNIIEIYDAQ